MLQRILLIVLIIVFSIQPALSSESLKKVYIMTSSMGDKIIPYVIAKRLGFYREEGLEIEVVLSRSSVAIQGIIGGCCDYVNHTSSTPAILRGIPLKVVLIDSDKPAHYFVASAKITTFKELSGKIVAIDDFAGHAALLARELLARNEVPLNKVSLRVLGPPRLRIQGLLGGLVDATMLNYVMTRKAQKEGFRILAYTGDYVSVAGPSLVTTQKKIKTSPDRIYKAVKATLKGYQVMYQNPKAALKFFMEVQRLKDVDFARDAYNARLVRSTDDARDGTASEKTMKGTIEQMKHQLKLSGAPLKVKGPLTPEKVYDFSFVRRANKELKAEGWDPRKYRYIKKR